MGRKRKEKAEAAEAATGEANDQNRSPHRTMNVRLEPWLADAFDRWFATLRPKPTTKAAVVMIFEDFLREKGFISEITIEHSDKS